MVGGAFVEHSLISSVGKEHLPGPPWGLGSLLLTQTKRLSEARPGEGSPGLSPTSAVISAS